jgi:hypothetical protein
LSNFFLTPITIALSDEHGNLFIEKYPSTEHAYQAAKTFNTGERAEFQREEITPGTAKRMGQLVTLRKDWSSYRMPIMARLIDIKFQQPELRQMLIDTAPKLLIEGNYWHDLFYGVCFCAKHQGEGLNNLGRLLMNKRRSLQENRS